MVVNSWRWHRPNLVLAASFFLAFIATFAGAAPAASASDTQSTQVIPPGLEISPEEVEKLNEILGISAPVLPGAGLETTANGTVGPYKITAFSDGGRGYGSSGVRFPMARRWQNRQSAR